MRVEETGRQRTNFRQGSKYLYLASFVADLRKSLSMRESFPPGAFHVNRSIYDEAQHQYGARLTRCKFSMS